MLVEVPQAERSDFVFGVRGAKRYAYNLALAALDGNSPSKFVDLCAGSNVVAREIRNRESIPVVTNDVNFLSVCIARSLIDCGSLISNVDAGYSAKGSVSTNPLVLRYFQPTVAAWIDGYVSQFRNEYLMLAALGGIFLRKATFRGATLNAQYGQRLTVGLLVDEVQRFLKRKILLSRSGPPVTSYWGDGRKLLETIEPGGAVYIDPAWPDLKGTTSYRTWARQINVILAQYEGLVPEVSSWTRTNVMGHVLEWLNIAVEKFCFVLLATQTSNFPTPEELIRQLAGANFKVRSVYIQQLTSTLQHRNVLEYLLCIEGKGPEQSRKTS